VDTNEQEGPGGLEEGDGGLEEGQEGLEEAEDDLHCAGVDALVGDDAAMQQSMQHDSVVT